MTGTGILPSQDMTSQEVLPQINVGVPNTINKDICKVDVLVPNLIKDIRKVVGTMDLLKITHHSKIMALLDKEIECQ